MEPQQMNQSGTISPPAASGALLAVEIWILRKILARLGSPPLVVVLWNGEQVYIPPTSPMGRVIIRDPAALRKLLRSPGMAFGDAYGAGAVEIEGNLVECMAALFRALQNAPSTGLLGRVLQVFQSGPRSHTRDQSRESVYHHYDIGNDFYKLWLDERMLYTCAYFPEQSLTLEQAQLAKMDHVCRKLRISAGDSVVEAGCGWGSLALHIAGKYGARVRAFNLSHEQIAYAREQATRQGLTSRVEFIEEDYRNISGQFDAFVSVGMLEHVGRENFTELGRVIDRALTPVGRGLIHSIGRPRARPMDEWTEKRIFPGAYPPSLREMMDIFEPCDFSVLDVENLRLHYARTIEHWLARYENSYEAVVDMFDEQFARMWRFYLASSVAVFLTGDLQLYQVLFARGTNNDLPWSRAYMYHESSS